MSAAYYLLFLLNSKTTRTNEEIILTPLQLFSDMNFGKNVPKNWVQTLSRLCLSLQLYESNGAFARDAKQILTLRYSPEFVWREKNCSIRTVKHASDFLVLTRGPSTSLDLKFIFTERS